MRILMGLMILFLPVTALSAIYKWVDADGKVHYSDKKQTAAKPTAIKTQPGLSQEEMDQAQQRHQKLKQAEESAKMKQEAQRKKETEDQAKMAEKKKECLRLIDEIEHVKYAPAVYYKDKNGERVYVDDATRDQYLNKTQSAYDEHCR